MDRLKKILLLFSAVIFCLSVQAAEARYEVRTPWETSLFVQDADTTESETNSEEVSSEEPADTTSAGEGESEAGGDGNTDQSQEETSETEGNSEEVAEDVPEEVSQLRNVISFGKVINVILLLIFTYFINKYLSIILSNLSEKVTHYRLFIKRLEPISRVFIWSFAIYIAIAGIISPPFETIIAIGASVGIAVGFASQDILKNIFGGIIIILDRPFQVGDKINVNEHYGEVITIGLRSSRIVTPDDSTVSIPNAELMSKSVSNSNSSELDCQVVAEIFLPASTDVNQVKQIAKRAVYASSYTYLNKPVEVIVLNEMLDRQFVIKMRVKAYVIDIRYEFLFKSDMTEMILNECNRLGLIPMSESIVKVNS